jgi:nitrogen regulatory protein P-II 1
MVVHSTLQQALADFLRSKNLQSFIFTHVEEHSAQFEDDAYLSMRDKVVGYVPKVRLDVILADDEVKTLIAELRESGQSFKGRSLYWVTNVEASGEL